MGSDDDDRELDGGVSIFQSTLPHGERRLRQPGIWPSPPISIHAPAWGATHEPHPRRRRSPDFNPRSRMGSDRVDDLGHDMLDQISIHAPAWGATRHVQTVGAEKIDFNPRSRMGSDEHGGDVGMSDIISIHAPAWGATIADGFKELVPKFQSTLPHGERRSA